MDADDLQPAEASLVTPPTLEKRVLLLPPTSRDGDAIHRILTEAQIESVICPTMQALCGAIPQGVGAAIVSEESLSQGADELRKCVSEQAVWSDLPILVLSRSGAESPRLAAALTGLGNVSVIERPVRISTLLSLVQSAVRARLRQYEVGTHLAGLAKAEALLRQSESRFRLMADSIPNLAWTARPDGNIFWYNKRWYEYTGTTPQQMEGWGWQNVHSADVLPKVVERWRASLATGQPFEMEFPLRAANGQFRMFLTQVAPLRGSDGRILQWFGTNTDISEQRRATEERELLLESERAARSEAEQASRIKDEFLATLSHEIRTPLNAILGWAQIIRRGGCKPAEVVEGIEVIERNGRAQGQIIEDMLDMSRIVSGKMSLNVQSVDLSDVVRAAADTVGTAANAKEIRVQLFIEPGLGDIRGDPHRLQQVFWNLMSNAIKFTPKGGEVRARLERVDSHVQISVTDTGEGIASEFLPHVFDRFRQADGATTRRHGGLGLGLAIVKQLVELHGGTVSARSAGRGQGATFIVSLPIARVDLLADAALPVDAASAETATVRDDGCVAIGGARVLVVDDEPDARTLIRRVLEDCSAEVTTASSAAEAFAVFRTGKPDVLICDIAMPGEDGYSLLKRIRGLGQDAGGDVPAIALTAFARSEDRVKSASAGFQHHLAKPVETSELLALVASLVRRSVIL